MTRAGRSVVSRRPLSRCRHLSLGAMHVLFLHVLFLLTAVHGRSIPSVPEAAESGTGAHYLPAALLAAVATAVIIAVLCSFMCARCAAGWAAVFGKDEPASVLGSLLAECEEDGSAAAESSRKIASCGASAPVGATAPEESEAAANTPEAAAAGLSPGSTSHRDLTRNGPQEEWRVDAEQSWSRLTSAAPQAQPAAAMAPATQVEFQAKLDEVHWPVEMVDSRLAARVSVCAAGDWECTITSGLRADWDDAEAFLRSGGWDRKCGRGWPRAEQDKLLSTFVNHALQFAPAMAVSDLLHSLGVDLMVDGGKPELQTRRQRRRLRALLRSGEVAFDRCRLERYDGNSCLATALTGGRFYIFEFYTS